jgi:hypothetical protein
MFPISFTKRVVNSNIIVKKCISSDGGVVFFNLHLTFFSALMLRRLILREKGRRGGRAHKAETGLHWNSDATQLRVLSSPPPSADENVGGSPSHDLRTTPPPLLRPAQIQGTTPSATADAV